MRERLIHAEERLDYLLERLPQPPARPIAFLHVPKSAGTSFTAALIDAIKPRCAVGGYDHCLFGGFRDFRSFVPERRRNIYAGQHEISPFCDMLAGHFALSTIRAWRQDAAVVTILREPMTRLLSHWIFWRTEMAEYQQTLGGWHAYVAHALKPFAAFLAAPEVACQTDNAALRMLLWPHKLIPDQDFIPPEHDEALLAEAHHRLDTLACVNITENPDLAADMAAWLKRPFALPRLKQTTPVPPHLAGTLAAELTPQAHQIWRERTRLDQALWARAGARVMRDANMPQCREDAISRAVLRYGALLAREEV